MIKPQQWTLDDVYEYHYGAITEYNIILDKRETNLGKKKYAKMKSKLTEWARHSNNISVNTGSGFIGNEYL